MERVLVKSVYDAFDYALEHYYPFGLEEFAQRTDRYVVISIQDTHTNGFGIQFTASGSCEDVLTLFFDDIEQYVEGAKLFSREQAAQIIRFIEKNENVETLLVHCYGGESRSRAVGAFAEEMLGRSSQILFRTGNPNMHVYNTLKDVYDKMENIIIRPYTAGDEIGMAELVASTMRISNQGDYSPEEIEELIKEHSPEFFLEHAKVSHFYLACADEQIIGCGGITGYWGSKTESYLLSIFVLPEWQGLCIGSQIVKMLEQDEYFDRAWRTEVASSITAVDFYRKLGYEYKNGITSPDEDNVIRLEKRN